MDERTQRFGKEGGGNQQQEQTDSFLTHCYVITVRDGRGFVNQLSEIQNISICNNFLINLTIWILGQSTKLDVKKAAVEPAVFLSLSLPFLSSEGFDTLRLNLVLQLRYKVLALTVFHYRSFTISSFFVNTVFYNSAVVYDNPLTVNEISS